MNKQLFHFQIAVKEVKNEGDKGVYIQGYASTPDIDRYKDIVEPAAFQEALTMYMKNPVILRSHEPDEPVGTCTQARITSKGLWIEALIVEEKTKTEILDGRMRAMSIGYIPLESTLQHEDGSPFNAEQDSVWDSSLIRVIKRLDLVEISIVSTPANGNALFSVAQSVKSYFNQLVTKNMKINKKDTAEEIKDEAKVAEQETEAENAESEAKNEDETTDVKENLQENAAEGEQKEAENIETKEETETTGDEAGNSGETPEAESGEAKSEEPSADAKTEETAVETEVENVQAISVDEETAKSLPELVKAGFLVESKNADAVKLPKSVTGLIERLVKALADESKRASELEAKLSTTPEKRSLKVQGQFVEEKEAPATSKKEASKEFMALFGR